MALTGGFEEKVLELLETKLGEVKRSKRKAPKKFEFKKKGNRIQAEFNEGLLDKLYDLKDLIKRGSVRRSKNLVNDLIDDVEKRIKHIRIADKSPAGWATVQEYLTDDVASDSEDDRKLRKAEKRALDKSKSLPAKKRAENVKEPSTQTSSGPSRVRPPSISGRPDRRRSSRSNYQCFRCGRFGHIRDQCYAKSHVSSTQQK